MPMEAPRPVGSGSGRVNPKAGPGCELSRARRGRNSSPSVSQALCLELLDSSLADAPMLDSSAHLWRM